MKLILEYIKKFREKRTKLELIKNLSILLSFLLISGILFVTLESLFYLSSINRKNIILFLIIISFISTFYIITIWLIKSRSLLGVNGNEYIAKAIGLKNNLIKDKLLNAVQLYKDQQNLDLTKLAIKNLKEILISSPIDKSGKILPYKYLYTILILILVFSSLQLFKSQRIALSRIIQYKSEFTAPTPFNIKNITKKNYALTGDTLNIDFKVYGQIPDSLTIFWIEENKLIKKVVAQNNGIYSYRFNNIKGDITYWTKYDKVSYFSAWDSIGTNPIKIKVKQRPIIIKNLFTVTEPTYTNSKQITFDNSSETYMDVLENSKISFEFKANKSLSNAWMLINNNRINLDISNNIINGEFILKEDSKIRIYCLDDNLTPNLNPTQFSFQKIDDLSPILIINSPENEFEIDESYTIPIIANIRDDYGINDYWIEYKTVSPGFINNNPNIRYSLYNSNQIKAKEINIDYNWDIDNLGLLMGDEIHFWLFAKDNNPNNSTPSQSRKFIGRFPSLGDIFSEINNYENESTNWIDEIKETINEISEITQDAELELLKEENISFENEKNIEESLSKIEDISDDIKNIQDNIDNILDKAEKNNIFDQNLLEKFNDFQDMLSNIMTPELQKSMEDLQEALSNLDPEKLADALENFEFNLEEFESQLDRFMDMFKLAQAEQMLNELAKSIENLIDQQKDLIADLESESKDDKSLNSKSSKQEQRLDSFKNLLSKTEQTTKEFSEDISNKLDSLSNSTNLKEASQSIQETTTKINTSNIDEAQEKSEASLESLSKISKDINDIKDEFLEDSIKEIKNEFISIINNSITITNQQENIIYESKGIRSNSPKIRMINENQNHISRELNKLMEQLVILSSKTFYISPSINRAFGQTSSNIYNAISNFEQKKISTAKTSQKSALSSMNLITELLIDALNEMQDNNSPSGIEQFMESMEDMSGQQQGINQATMQLSQMGMMQQQSILEGLQSQQQKLKEELGDLISEFPGQNNGSMEKILSDMEEIINDFENKNITKETMERQQRILSRMLDNQKSLTQKDYSNKRDSKKGQDFEYLGSKQLPENLGDKNLLLINAMESAMDEGYSIEYNKLIRNYFLNLQKETDGE